MGKLCPASKYSIGKDKIVVYIKASEYNYIESLAQTRYSNRKQVIGVVKTYAIIKFFSSLNPTQIYVPILRKVFKQGVSSKNYRQYIAFLEKERIIDTKNRKIVAYTDAENQTRIKSASANRYRLLLLEYQFQKTIFPNPNEKLVPVIISLSKETMVSIRNMCKAVTEGKANGFQAEKLDSLMVVPDNESYLVAMVVKLIKDVHCGKVNSLSRFSTRIKKIADQDRTHTSRETKITKYESLVYMVLDRLYQSEKKEKKKKKEQITDYFLAKYIDNQSVIECKKRKSAKGKFAYYRDLSVDYEGLDYCVTMMDLYNIARIAEVPRYKYPSLKLYSKLASIRRNIRKYVRYKDSPLVEVSDIHSAHYTLLPLVFEKCNINISGSEMAFFKYVTQCRDLYGEAILNTSISRDEIKPVFQAFFSIKNENMFLYNKPEWDRQKRQVVCDYFKSTFPEIYKALLSFHCNQSDTIKSVANEIEGLIMNSICDEIRREGLHPFRVHDAIYLPEDEVPRLQIDIKQMVYDKINGTKVSPIIQLPIVTGKTIQEHLL